MSRLHALSITLLVAAHVAGCGGVRSGALEHGVPATEDPASVAMSPADQSALPASGDAPLTASSPADEAALPAPARMTAARAVSEKIGVPVDVRYELTSAPVQNQPTTLHLVFIPRVAGNNLRVEYRASSSVAIDSAAPAYAIAKAQPAGIYRSSLVVTPRSAESGEVRVLVSMDTGGGRFFSIFSIPVAADPSR